MSPSQFSGHQEEEEDDDYEEEEEDDDGDDGEVGLGWAQEKRSGAFLCSPACQPSALLRGGA